MRFADLLDAVDDLTAEELVELGGIVRRRLIERKRDELAGEIQQSRRDSQAGRCQPRTPDEILRDIISCSD